MSWCLTVPDCRLMTDMRLGSGTCLRSFDKVATCAELLMTFMCDAVDGPARHRRTRQTRPAWMD